ncbi:MAG: hypothetical protein ACKO7N_07470, partial [Candidatus Nitrosotenuis sp.]
KKILKPHGMIYLEVPNIDDALLKLFNISAFKERYYRAPHTYYYSTSTLEQILSKSGFEGKSWTAQDYTLFNHIHWITSGTPQSSLEDGYEIPDFSSEKSMMGTDMQIKKFFTKVNSEYKRILEKNNIAENVCYMGKLR